jgi:hypothetical protein
MVVKGAWKNDDEGSRYSRRMLKLLLVDTGTLEGNDVVVDDVCL